MLQRSELCELALVLGMESPAMLDHGTAATVQSPRGGTVHAPHARGVDDVLAALDTSAEGLPEAEARRRQDKYGPNAPPQHLRTPVWMRFLRQFHHVLIYVLIGSAVVTFLLDHLIDTGVILAVIFANAIIGFLQEGKAEKAMDAIQ
ncbi:MAG: cation-transporting P-type ATPase, partial [Pseudomonadota bacterium]